MPVGKSYTRAQWDELARSLESLPVKPEAEQRVSITDAMKEMRPVIGAVRIRVIRWKKSLIMQGRMASILALARSSMRYIPRRKTSQLDR